MSFHIASQYEDQKWSVTLSGDLDIYATSAFKEELSKLLDKENKDIVIDCENLNYIDSTGLGALISVYQNVSENGHGIRLKNTKPNIKKIFEITRLDEIFEFEEV